MEVLRLQSYLDLEFFDVLPSVSSTHELEIYDDYYKFYMNQILDAFLPQVILICKFLFILATNICFWLLCATISVWEHHCLFVLIQFSIFAV